MDVLDVVVHDAAGVQEVDPARERAEPCAGLALADLDGDEPREVRPAGTRRVSAASMGLRCNAMTTVDTARDTPCPERVGGGDTTWSGRLHVNARSRLSRVDAWEMWKGDSDVTG